MESSQTKPFQTETMPAPSASPSRRRSAWRTIWRCGVCTVLLIVALQVVRVHAALQPAQILVLHSYSKGLSWTDSITDGIETYLGNQGRPVDITYEYMDTKRVFDDTHLSNLRRLISHKLTFRQYDVVISSDDHAFRFLLANHHDLMPNTPAVFCGVNLFSDDMLANAPMFTGVVEAFDIRSTIEAALHVQPNLRQMLVIGDQTVSGKANRRQLEALLPDLPPSVAVTVMDNHSMAEVQSAVAKLPKDTCVLWLHFTADRLGQVFTFEASAEAISKASTAPLYSFWDFHLNHGIVGGMITSGFQQGRTAAALANRILGKTPVADIAVVKKSPNTLTFDFNQMKRFGITTDRLPENSTIINRPVSFYDTHRRLILALLAGFTAAGLVILALTVNVLKRHRAERMLTTSKDRYKHLFTAASVALIEEDCSALVPVIKRIREEADGDVTAYLTANPESISQIGSKIRILNANPAAISLYHAADRTQLLGPAETIVPAEAAPAIADLLSALVRKEAIFSTETVNRTLDGRSIDILMQLRIPHSPEQFDSVLVSVADITDRKRSEQALRLSETRFRTAFNNAATGMALVAMDGRYLRVNRALCRILGYSETELLHCTWMDITHPDDVAKSRNLVDQLSSGTNQGPIEKRYLDKWNRTIWVLLSGAVIFDDDGVPVYIITQFQDITRRRAAEEALREQERRYRRFFEDDLSGVFVATADGVMVTCNRVFAHMFGFSSTEEALTQTFANRFPSSDDYQTLMNDMKRERSIQHRELLLESKDGRHLNVLINAVGHFNDENQIDEFQGYLADVSHQRSLEAQLLQAQKMESIGTMAGGVAHDFNNLLMGVLGNTSLLLMTKSESDPDYPKLKNIEEYVQSGSELTRQLLGFAKGGKYEVHPLDLNILIERNTEMFGRTRKEVRIELALSPDLRLVDADRSQIDQVLYNLYVNAWQAMTDGGMLSIRTTNCTLDEAFLAPYGLDTGDYVHAAVSDNGIGMPPETLKRIFDPFFTTKEISRGTGLGLASAYGIIKNHGGIITVDSRPDHGTTFDFYLPASASAIAAPSDSRMESPTVTGREAILLVDDEQMIVEVGKEMLTALGYRVAIADCGQAAIDAVTADPDIALVVLDMIMPGMSGGDTFDAIKAIRPTIRVLLSSGYTLDGQAERIMERGCNGFLQKPFNMKELSRKIREIIDTA